MVELNAGSIPADERHHPYCPAHEDHWKDGKPGECACSLIKSSIPSEGAQDEAYRRIRKERGIKEG